MYNLYMYMYVSLNKTTVTLTSVHHTQIMSPNPKKNKLKIYI